MKIEYEIDYIETYKGFDLYSDPGRMQILAFPVGGQVCEHTGESMDDIHMTIDELP